MVISTKMSNLLLNLLWTNVMKIASLRYLKRHITFANSVIFVGAITAFLYIFSYCFPITDNAFVVNNVRPVAALVKGYVTNVYVKNGDVVKKGKTLCILEAMKIMNEVEAEFDCKILEILVTDGSPVEYDMPIFVVEKL